MASGADTRTHTRIPTRGPKQFQETRHAQPKAARAWFKKKKQSSNAKVYGVRMLLSTSMPITNWYLHEILENHAVRRLVMLYLSFMCLFSHTVVQYKMS